MNVTLENLSPCKKLVRFEEDIEAVNAAFEKTTKEFQKQVKLQGFRPGKAPVEMVIKHYEKEIEEEVKRRLMSACFQQGIKEHKLQVVGNPAIEEIQFGRGVAFQFAATLEVAPQFELPEYTGLPAKREKSEVTPEEVDRALGILQEQRAEFKAADRPLQDGDFVVVNYLGTCDGKPIKELAPAAQGLTEKKKFWLEVKKDSFIPGFTEQLVGAKAGETRTVNIDFPEDFVTPELIGKKGVFEVEILEVKERQLPEINDEFAVSFGAGDLNELREGVTADLRNELNLNKKRSVRNQVRRALLDRVSFELPESLVEHMTRNVVYRIVAENQKRGVERDVIEKEKEGIYAAATQQAKEHVKEMYLYSRIAEKEGIRVTNEELNARIIAIAQAQKVAPEQLVKEMKKNDQLEEVHQQIVHEKVIAFLQENAKIEDVEPGALSPSA